MLTEWWPYLPAFLALIAFLWVPGLLLLWAFGQRTGLILLVAPAFSVAIIGLTGVILDPLEIPYTPLSQAVATVIVALIGWPLGRLVGRGGYAAGSSAAVGIDDPEVSLARRRAWLFPTAAAIGLTIGAALLLRRLLLIINDPQAIAQRWDNVFHLNAIRYIVDTGRGSTLTLGQLTNPDSTIAYYPSAWHQLTSLAVPLTGDHVFIAHNLSLLVIAGIVWPASCIFLTRCIMGPSALVAVTSGVAAAGFGIFPIGLMAWGPLFPNMLSLSLLPIALGLLVRMLGPRVTVDPTARTLNASGYIRIAALFMVTLGALCVSQPNGVLALLVVAVPLSLFRWWLSLRSAVVARRRRRIPVLIVVALVSAAGLLWAWNILTTDRAWKPFSTIAQAVGEALLYATNGREDVPWVLFILTVAGLYAIIRRKRLGWLALAHLLLIVLYVMAAAVENGPIRQWLISGWYADSYRLAATLPLTAVPLIAFGAQTLVRALSIYASHVSSLIRLSRLSGGIFYVVIAMVFLAVTTPLSQMGSLTQATRWSKQYYAWDGKENILSAEEYDLLEHLDQFVGPEEVVAVNPWNGGSLAYAVTGRPVTQYHIQPPDPALLPIVEDIDDASPGSKACLSADKLHIHWVLDFGTQFLVPNAVEGEVYSGITAINSSTDKNLRLVDHSGSASLYEIVGCSY